MNMRGRREVRDERCNLRNEIEMPTITIKYACSMLMHTHISPLLSHFFPLDSRIYCLTRYPESVLQTHTHTNNNNYIVIRRRY